MSLKRIFWRNNIVAFAPFLYVPATLEGQPVVVIGSWFEKPLPVDKSEVFVTGLEKLHPTWKVTGQWPADDDATGALVGRRLAERLNLHPGQALTLAAAARGQRATRARTLFAGGIPRSRNPRNRRTRGQPGARAACFRAALGGSGGQSPAHRDQRAHQT